MLESLIREGQEDRHRPWSQRTTGGVLVTGILLVLAAQVLLDLLLLNGPSETGCGEQPNRTVCACGRESE